MRLFSVQPGDSIDLTSYGFNDLAEVLENIYEIGAHTRFYLGGDTLLVLNTAIEDITFDIGAAA